MLTLVSIRASITFVTGLRSEIGRYEVHREESLPGFGMTLDDFQIAGFRHDVTESLKSTARYFNRLGSKVFGAGKVGSLDLRSSRALILSNISSGTGSVLIRCRPKGIWCDAAF